MAAKKKKKEKVPEESRLQSVLEKYESLSGKSNQIVMLGDNAVIHNVPVIPSGIFSLDAVIGVGGFPQGRMIELWGNSSSGKTTVSLQCIAAVQQKGGLAAYLDLEYALDVKYAADLGVDLNSLLLVQPGSGEDAFESIENLANVLGPGDVIVVDSVAALTPKKEISGDFGDSHVGLLARLMSQGLRKITSIVSRSGVTVLFINQVRVNIGQMFGDKRNTPGGNALKFGASVRVEVAAGSKIKDKVSGEIIGMVIRLKVPKNKVAPPFRTLETEMRFGRGIHRPLDLLIQGILYGVIQMKGSSYLYEDSMFARGKEAAYQAMIDSPEFCNEVEAKLREEVLPGRG
ncbi:recombinase RecA [bacterium]|nr:recombinase RecA [bacterium]